MNIKEMTNEQLIAHIDDLNKKIEKLKINNKNVRKTDTALRIFDEQFSIFFNMAPIGLVISNTQGTIINANKTILDLLGYTSDIFTKMNITQLYANPAERKKILEILYTRNQVFEFEIMLKHADGTLKTVLINADYIESNNEKVILTSVFDITQFKKIQDDLMLTEKEYHSLFNNAPIGIAVVDAQGNVIACNEAIQELMGYNEKELHNMNAYDFYYDATERRRLLLLTKKSNIIRDFETKFRHKNGSIINVLMNTDLIDFKEHKNVLLTSVRSITNLKQIEEELTKERDFISAVLNTAASLVMVLDSKGKVLRFNRACEEITGYSFKDIKERYIWESLPADPDLTKERVKQLLQNSPSRTYEAVWLTKNGDERLISWAITTLTNQNQTEYIVATGIDITEQRKAETDLKKANQKLLAWVEDLKKRTEEMNQLIEMGEHLQNCQTIKEACTISSQYIKQMFPLSHGALYLINSSKNLAEAFEVWGEPLNTEKLFAPLNCWAVRRGRPHLIDHKHKGLLCEHVHELQNNGQYLCVPLLTSGEVIGILHLNYNTAAHEIQQDSDFRLFTEQNIQLIVTIAERIALAISNLRLKESLRQQSIRDPLTSLFNRRYMEESLEREISRAKRENTSIGIIMFDIDHFKNFNDNAGHDAGDALLKELGLYLRRTTRAGDIVSRYGGEEFVAVLPGASLNETIQRAEELRLGIKGLTAYHLGKPLDKCTISLGVAAFAAHGSTTDVLLKNADNALYKAKKEGRDRVVVVDDL
jgi:diguanylate cyclase (GGDEF)-like protein/PAS domain S-box-containing protein